MPRGLNVPRKWKKINQKSKTCLNTVLRVLLLENNAYLYLKQHVNSITRIYRQQNTYFLLYKDKQNSVKIHYIKIGSPYQSLLLCTSPPGILDCHQKDFPGEGAALLHFFSPQAQRRRRYSAAMRNSTRVIQTHMIAPISEK